MFVEVHRHQKANFMIKVANFMIKVGFEGMFGSV